MPRFVPSLVVSAVLTSATASVRAQDCLPPVPVSVNGARLTELVLEGGAGEGATKALAAELVDAICGSHDVSLWLETTCGSPLRSIADLRVRLLTDVTRGSLRATGAAMVSSPEARLELALFQALQASPSLASVLYTVDSSLAGACHTAVTPRSNDSASLAVRLIARVVQLGNPATGEAVARAAESVLLEAGRGAPGQAFSPQRLDSSVRLLNAVRASRFAEARLGSARGGAIRPAFFGLAGSLVDTLERALECIENRPVTLFAAREALRAMDDGNLDEVATAAFSLPQTRAAPEPVRRAVRAAVGLLMARTEADAERMVRSFILPAWLVGLIADANVGKPIVSDQEFSLDFEGTLGWKSRGWGAWVNVAQRTYDGQLAGRDTAESRSTVQGRAWFDIDAPNAAYGMSLGVDVGFDQLYSDLTLLDSTAVTTDEVSQMVRGGLSTGFWVSKSPFTLRLSISGGGHREFYTRDLTIPSGPEAGYSTTDDERWSGDYRARALLGYHVLPGVLSASLQGRLAYFQITRSTAFFRYDFDQSFTAQDATTTAARLETSGRFLLGLDAVAIAQCLRPGVYGELAYVRTDDGSARDAKAVPSVGVFVGTYVTDVSASP